MIDYVRGQESLIKPDKYMIINVDRCWGCKSCEVACRISHGASPGVSPMRVIEIGPRHIKNQLHRDWVPVPCQHCDHPNCVSSCAVNAIHKDVTGTVTIDRETCIGCGACEAACPYGAIEMTGKNVSKCDLCFERTNLGWAPSCEQHCIGKAIKTIKADDLDRVIKKCYHYKIGLIVYISEKWNFDLISM